MWIVVSKKPVISGRIWRRVDVLLHPPCPIKRLRVKGLQAVWAPSRKPVFSLMIYYLRGYPYTIADWKNFWDVEDCIETARTKENEWLHGFAPVQGVSLTCWEEKEEKGPAFGLMKYTMEIYQAFPLFPVLPQEYYINTVEHYHTC